MTNAQYMRILKSKQYKSHGQTSLNTKTSLAHKYWSRSRLVEEGHPAQHYLAGRGLWPLLPHEELRCGRRYDAHAGEEGIDAFYLIASLHDHEGQFTAVQYLRMDHEGDPFIAEDGHKDRVTIGPAKGCSVWMHPPLAEKLGVAEGMETAMAVRRLYGIPCFATLGAWGMKSFRPPRFVEDLVVFADHDTPGLAAAGYLCDRMRGLRDLGGAAPATVTIFRPKREGDDFADVWESRQ